MENVQISSETKEKLDTYCKAKGETIDSALEKAVNWLYGRLRVKYDWPHTWNTRGKPKLTDEQRETIFKRYSENASPVLLAKEYGVSRQTVYNIVKRYKA